MGLMGHANTSSNFQKMFREFKGTNIVKMADSGVFTKQGNLVSGHEQLFEIYENMSVEYGIIIDVIKDKKKTIRNAKEAIRVYEKSNCSFRLVGVAQGSSVSDYLNCYDELKDLGFEFIAIGGLLKKVENTIRYVKVRNEEFLEDVVKSIRSKHPSDWLFLLGCYHPNRHQIFKKYDIFGADYKGWILNYKNPNQIIQELEGMLSNIEDELGVDQKDLLELKKKYHSLLEKPKRGDLNKLGIEILSIRLKVNEEKNNTDYSETLEKFKYYLLATKEELRKERFIQIKKYLKENVFQKIRHKKLLIISCSARKKKLQHVAPAVEVYDGPFFRVLRKMKANKKCPLFHIRIISAKYGLITPNTPIGYYDQRITKKNPPEWSKMVLNSLKLLIRKNNYSEIFVCVGKDYLSAMGEIEKYVPLGCKLTYAQGKIGQKLRVMKNWVTNMTQSINSNQE
jgi:hypothetical protein